MDHQKAFEEKINNLRAEGSFDCSNPVTALDAVGDSLGAWDDLLRESPEYLSNLILKNSGRELLHLSIAAMRACVSQVQEVIGTRAKK